MRDCVDGGRGRQAGRLAGVICVGGVLFVALGGESEPNQRDPEKRGVHSAVCSEWVLTDVPTEGWKGHVQMLFRVLASREEGRGPRRALVLGRPA